MLLYPGTIKTPFRAERETVTTATKTAQAEARDYLLEMVKPGTTVYTDLRHVNRMGDQRWMDVFIVDGERIRNITSLVCKAADLTYCTRRHALKIGGGGMDMGLQVVYNLGCSLWPTGTPEPHGTRNGEPDSNGGYALRHQWL